MYCLHTLPVSFFDPHLLFSTNWRTFVKFFFYFLGIEMSLAMQPAGCRLHQILELKLVVIYLQEELSQSCFAPVHK